MTEICAPILVIYYSHSGQTREAMRALSEQLTALGHEVLLSAIQTKEEMPFPWSRERFFGIFPETVLRKPQTVYLNPEPPPKKDWSLIILAFPPWFLSPARPFYSFLQSGWLNQIDEDIPVFALTTCRNMWVAAMNDVKEILGTRLKGFAVFSDPNPNLVSLFSTLRFLLKGQKRLFGSWGPEAGFSVLGSRQKLQQIAQTLNESLRMGNWENLQKAEIRKAMIPVKPELLLMEIRGRRNFLRFARFIESAPDETKRRGRIRLLGHLLPLAVVVLSPITSLITLLQSMFHSKKLRKLCELAASPEPLPSGTFAAPQNTSQP